MLLQHLQTQLQALDATRLRRRLRVTLSPCAPQQKLLGDEGQSQPMLAFCSNDYLGLAQHPDIAAALLEGVKRYGVGSGASHLISGHSQAHAQLEKQLAQWQAPHIPDAHALFFSTGYAANLALLTALGDAQTTLFCDALNHASLIDGARLSKAQRVLYQHDALDDLQSQLQRCTSPIKLIVTDAVFSMDGHLAPLADLLKLAQTFDAWLVIDDAHGLGVLGPQGRGSLAHAQLRSERLIYMGTLGKAAGVAGAFVAAHPTITEWLVQKARSYIYSTATPPALAHALQTSLALIAGPEGEQRRAHLMQLLRQFREQVTALVQRHPGRGWRLLDSQTPIQGIVVRSNEQALALSNALERQGLWVPAIRPPTVPQGTARLRITLSAAHSAKDVNQLVDALEQAV